MLHFGKHVPKRKPALCEISYFFSYLKNMGEKSQQLT